MKLTAIQLRFTMEKGIMFTMLSLFDHDKPIFRGPRLINPTN